MPENPPGISSERDRDKKLIIIDQTTGHNMIFARGLKFMNTSEETASRRKAVGNF
jgi:hypothetical protein